MNFNRSLEPERYFMVYQLYDWLLRSARNVQPIRTRTNYYEVKIWYVINGSDHQIKNLRMRNECQQCYQNLKMRLSIALMVFRLG